MAIVQSPESQNVEFKESWRDEYLKWVCGFANACGGYIYIGVADGSHEIVGVTNSKRLMEEIPNKIVSSLGIIADVNLKQADGLDYIEIIVSPSNIPISYKGAYHYRSGSTKQELKGAALQDFLLRKLGRTWDDVSNDEARIEDIDRDAIDYFLRKSIAAQRIPESMLTASTEEILTSLQLLDNEGKLKNAAILLFGKNPGMFFHSVEFKIGRFGSDVSDLIIQDIIEGNIIQMADKVVDILRAKYLVSPVRFEGMQRYENLEVPIEALREIVYNAIAHKNYMGPAIQMHVYDDRIELWNDGSLPEGFTAETLYTNHPSRPRNPKIAGAMFKAGFIDTWGRGYEKIYAGFKKNGLPIPTVSEHFGGVQIVIERPFFKRLNKNGVVNGVVNDKNGVVNDKNVGVNDKNVVVNDKNVGVNDKNVGVNGENVGRNDKNVGRNCENVGVNGEIGVVNDKIGVVNDKNGVVNVKNGVVNVKIGVVNDKNGVVNDKNGVVNVVDNALTPAQKKIAEKCNAIIEKIKINSFITATELSESLLIPYRTIQRYLANMQASGILIREGSDKSGRWLILNDYMDLGKNA